MFGRWKLIAGFVLLLSATGVAQPAPPKPCGPIPNANQLRWQKMEFYAFVHLSVNTFTDQEWGNGDEDPKIFNPEKLDCRQWARIAKEAGMKGIIITAKHHSGFCLWPSKYTDYSVKHSPWRGGKGDIVGDLAKACREYGLKLGIYLSPWDRNSAVYGKPEYITYFRNQLRELLTHYGDIFEVWFDGANGGSGYYGGARETRTIDRKTYYDWPNTYKLVRSLQPKAVIWNDGGDRADLRWVGTEAGNVGETNWSLLRDTGDVPYNMLHYGLEDGNAWVPAEVNTSIRPGWFYHSYEDDRVKTLPQLLDIYYSSQGRNGALLLNFPIDRHGLIHATDEKAVLAFAQALRKTFAINLAAGATATASNIRGNSAAFGAQKAVDGDNNSYWATDDSVTKASITLDLHRATTFNRFLVQEYIPLGQRVKTFTVEALIGDNWKQVAAGTTIGYKRILCFNAVTAREVRLTITGAKACPLISNIGLYNEVLSAPAITGGQPGKVLIKPAETREAFDMSRKNWKIHSTDPKSIYAIDGDPGTTWQQARTGKMPVDLVIDLGKDENVAGFRYLPDQGGSSGVITDYEFYISMDTMRWTLADKGEFSNIRNNPVWQVKTFRPVKGRYVRLRALRNTAGDDAAGYAEFDVISRSNDGHDAEAAAHAQHNEHALGTLFDGHWKFALGDNKTAMEPGFDDKAWRTIDLPHDWSIEGVPDRQNPSKGPGGYFPTGIGWYRKTFMAAPSWKGKEISIFFEGVYMNAEVFINGHSLGVHPYGYTSFYYDLTPWLHWSGDNVIAVRVDNSQQVNCRWYSGSGIYRHVRLAVRDPVHIDPWGVAITTPDASPAKATVNIDALLRNDGTSTADVMVSAKIIDRSRRVVAIKEASIWLPAKGESHFSQRVAVDRPLLWSVDSPNLYQVRLTLTSGAKHKDEYTSVFGIRTIRFSTARGFQLNGRTMKLYGGCVHHDNGCLGAAAFDRAEERRVELLKAAGFNAVRTSHNPPSIAFLDACDHLGLLVVDEAFDGWRQAKNPYDYTRYFDHWWRRDLTSMVLRDRNHPSVIIWSVGNEILERKSPDAINTAKNLVSLVHQFDTTRPVTSAMTTWDKEWEIYDPLFAVQDIAGYNYQLFRAASDHVRVPSRVIVQTESYPRDVFVNWNTIRQNSYIIGDFVWTAMDYLGESGIGRNKYPGEPGGDFWESEQFPWHGSYCGDIDLTGQRKPISHYRNILNNSTEKLYMAVREPKPDTGAIKETGWSVWPTWESWTWPGREGKNMDVEVYSKYPSVRLYLNDSLIGEKRCTVADEYKATFSLPYGAGMLKAVGSDPDGEQDSTILRTAAAPAAIRLAPDRKQLTADGEDLSYIDVELVDKNGTVDPNVANRLVFTVDGPGILAGVGNADMTDTDSYSGPSRKAWHGKALVVIRSTHKPGKITVTVRSQGLANGIITINSNRYE